MVSIGLLVAMPEEAEHMYSKLGEFVGVTEEYGFKVSTYNFSGKTVHIIGTGIGEISAGMAAQYLITKFKVDYILNFGVVGNFSKDLDCLDTVVVDKVVHYDYSLNAEDINSFGKYPFQREDPWFKTDESLKNLVREIEPNIPLVSCASGDKFVNTKELRDFIVGQFNADICEMESAAICLVCKQFGVPCLFIKTVSDNADGNSNVSFNEVIKGGVEAYVDLVTKILARI